MIYLDIDQLNARFWQTALTYTNAKGQVVTLSEGTSILTENQPPQDVDETKPFVIWTIAPGRSELVGISPSLFKQEGTAILSVFAPKGRGTGMAEDICRALENSFREWRSDDRCLRVKRIERAKGSDKDLHQVNVKLHYESKRMISVEGGVLIDFSDPDNSGLVAAL